LSYDNSLWVSTDTGSIVSLDLSDNQMKHVWSNVHDGEIDEMCWRRNCVITGGVDKKLKRWICKNKKTFELESSMDLDGNIISMTFDDQGITGIVSTSEATIWYIDWEASKKGSDKPDCMRLVSSHLSYITGLNYCNQKLVWDVKNVQQLLQFQVHGLSTTCVCFGKNGDYCIAGYSDGSLHTWDLKKVCVSSKNRIHKSQVTCLVVTKDGSKVISGSANGSLIMSDFLTCETKHVIDDHAGKPITCLDICKYTSTDLFLARYRKNSLVTNRVLVIWKVRLSFTIQLQM
jgi:WD40 repeat protein